MQMLKAIRWLLFVPAAFVASVVGSIFGTFAGSQLSEFIGFALSGVIAAIAYTNQVIVYPTLGRRV
jgi:hypothetical protein